MENRCVCCGDIIPEGRQVCPNCEYKYSGRKEEGQRIKPELDEILEFCEEIEGLLYISDMRSRRPGEYTRSGEVCICDETAEILRRGIKSVKRLCELEVQND